ncbi:MAG: acyl-CoA dehydrogenase family protein [Acidimicrobiaceae bacterium]|nr:acyl-CoA dehydrogenase family protein [Acidimicrobiaceae bacterium]
MDLELSPRYLEFRDECRTWLHANRPAEPPASMDSAAGFEEHRLWERTLFEGGWSVPAWPSAYGGRDCDLIEWLIYEEEYWLSGVPGRVSANGVSLLAPTIFNFGTQAQQDYFLPRMASGEQIWAQGWSEPEAGSDLAGIKTNAVRDGDDYVINGQKTWCSRGKYADWIFCIVRTDPTAERHAGLSYLLVPADAPGMTRRTIKRLDQESGFAEIFFDDCRVSADNVLGEPGQGWAVAMAAAGSERGLSLRSPGRFMAAAERLRELATASAATAGAATGTAGAAIGTAGAAIGTADAATGTADAATGTAGAAIGTAGAATGTAVNETGSGLDLRLRDEVVDAWIRAEAYRWQTYFVAAELMAGGDLGSEASLMKVFWSEMDLELHATALRLLGDDAEVPSDWLDGYVFALGGPIYAGTNEIQRNIIAERVLGLPRR